MPSLLLSSTRGVWMKMSSTMSRGPYATRIFFRYTQVYILFSSLYAITYVCTSLPSFYAVKVLCLIVWSLSYHLRLKLSQASKEIGAAATLTFSLLSLRCCGPPGVSPSVMSWKKDWMYCKDVIVTKKGCHGLSHVAECNLTTRSCKCTTDRCGPTLIKTRDYRLEGMSCGGCAASVKRILENQALLNMASARISSSVLPPPLQPPQ
eukprot:Gb_11819 [translate_table: standard]